MARKNEGLRTEQFAVLKFPKYKREVKVWQYYSIFDFCRSAGCSREKSDELARWCRDRRTTGDEIAEGELTIRIVEKEVSV